MDNPKKELYNLNAGAKRIVNVRFTSKQDKRQIVRSCQGEDRNFRPGIPVLFASIQADPTWD